MNFMRKKYHVKDEDRKVTFAKRAASDFKSPGFETGNVFILGLPGSGKTTLGKAIAERLELEFCEFSDGDQSELAALADRGGQVVAVNGLEISPETRAIVTGQGMAFYLLVDFTTLAQRGAGTDMDPETGRPAMSDMYENLEPVLMSCVHFVLQGAKSREEVLDDALERVGLAAR